jgi:hypothetical protein
MIMVRPTDLLPPDLRPPPPPAELRARVLTAARHADSTDGSADVWHRLWTSRPLRFAWAATVVGLICGHLLLGADVPAAPVDHALPVAAAAGGASELAEIAALDRFTAELPDWETAASTSHQPTQERNTS